jgi:hypothetical protein
LVTTLPPFLPLYNHLCMIKEHTMQKPVKVTNGYSS